VRASYWITKLQRTAVRSISHKINQGTYTTKRVSCCICESGEGDYISDYDAFGIYNPLKMCANCGFVYVEKPLDEKSLNLFYNDEYADLDEAFIVGPERKFHNQYKATKAKINFWEQHVNFNKVKTMLDFGCSYGGSMQVFHEIGVTSHGYELSEAARKSVGKKFPVFSRFEELAVGAYDLVLCQSVLEHVLDPIEVISVLCASLKPNGYMIISVPGLLKYKEKPNYQNWLRGFHIFPHLSYFSRHHLIYLCVKISDEALTVIYSDEYSCVILQKCGCKQSHKTDLNLQRQISERYVFTQLTLKQRILSLKYRAKLSIKNLLRDLKLLKR
jgi:2-polyprenyl-3-methyl-5-hydroxy-6-metoxy-1,4-benzoquinol methylase